MDDDINTEIYMKSGSVVRVHLADFWMKWVGGMEEFKWCSPTAPGVAYINVPEIEAIIVLKELPMAGQVYDSHGEVREGAESYIENCYKGFNM